jgi:hypothetical protein
MLSRKPTILSNQMTVNDSLPNTYFLLNIDVVDHLENFGAPLAVTDYLASYLEERNRHVCQQ